MADESNTHGLLKESMTQNPLVVLALSLVVAFFGLSKLNSIVTEIKNIEPIRVFHNKATVKATPYSMSESCRNLPQGNYSFLRCYSYNGTYTYTSGAKSYHYTCADLAPRDGNPISFSKSSRDKVKPRLVERNLELFGHPIYYINPGGFFSGGYTPKKIIRPGSRFTIKHKNDKLCLDFNTGNFWRGYSGKFSWNVKRVLK